MVINRGSYFQDLDGLMGRTKYHDKNIRIGQEQKDNKNLLETLNISYFLPQS
jgi:hypothetical protein